MRAAHIFIFCTFSLYAFVHYEEIPGLLPILSIYKGWLHQLIFSLLKDFKG